MSFIGRSLGRMETKVLDLSALRSFLFGGTAKSGVSVGIDSAMRTTSVLACVRAISEGIAQLPLKLQLNKDGRKSIAKEHPLHKVLWRKPNQFQTSFEWRESMLIHALLTRGAFSIISRNSMGQVLELLPVEPGRVTVVQGDDYKVTYDIRTSKGTIKTFDKKDILHLKGPSWDGFTGMDPMFLGREAIGLSIAAEESISRLYSNGSRPSGILSNKDKLQPPERASIAKHFQEGYAGLQNAFKTILLDGGWTYSQMSLSPVDSQTHESRKHQIEEICRLFRVFPQMIGYGDKTSTYASAEQFFMAHVTHTLGPWIERLEEVLATQLLTDEEQDAGFEPKFNVGGLLRGDAKSRAEYYASGIINGWLTRNEARGLEDFDPLDGLEKPLVPLNMGTSDQQGKTNLPKDPVNVKTLARDIAKELHLPDGFEEKIGRVISLANEKKLRQARDLIDEVVAQVEEEDDTQAAA